MRHSAKQRAEAASQIPEAGTRTRRSTLLALAGLVAAWSAGCAAPPAPLAPAPAAGLWSEEQRTGLKALGFQPVGEDWVLNLSTSLLFEFDSDSLMKAQQDRLLVVGRELLSLEVPRLRVEGHTDARGNAAYNQSLALRRARTVAQSLARAGWPQQRVQVQGFGDVKPIADNSTETGRAQNRRVVLIAMAA